MLQCVAECISVFLWPRSSPANLPPSVRVELVSIRPCTPSVIALCAISRSYDVTRTSHVVYDVTCFPATDHSISCTLLDPSAGMHRLQFALAADKCVNFTAHCFCYVCHHFGGKQFYEETHLSYSLIYTYIQHT